ncbi:MAG: hypothetical protein ACLQOO_26535 [Terriglobia bacterium]
MLSALGLLGLLPTLCPLGAWPLLDVLGTLVLLPPLRLVLSRLLVLRRLLVLLGWLGLLFMPCGLGFFFVLRLQCVARSSGSEKQE